MLWMYYFLTGKGQILFDDNLNPWDITEKLLLSRCWYWSWGHAAAFLSEHTGLWGCLEEHQPRGALCEQVGSCQGLLECLEIPCSWGWAVGLCSTGKAGARWSWVLLWWQRHQGVTESWWKSLKAEVRKALILCKGFSEIASKLFCPIEDGILLAKLFQYFFFHCGINFFFK